MLDASRIAHVEQAITAQEAAGQPWTNLTVYSAVGGSYHQLAKYLKARRAETRAVGAVAVLAPEAPLPLAALLAESRASWLDALRAVAAFEKRPPVRERAAQAAHAALRVVLYRQLTSAEGIWRPLEMQARTALATFLAWQAQAGRGSAVEQARCQDALQDAHAAVVALVGDTADPLATVQVLLAQPIIDGKPILPPLT